ncbi:hypothetical protein BH20ACT11_BH20ACT11_07330 [soil metagenome]|nr:E3 binding domain-containing protein [Actinomycetota bacterium]
MSNNENPGEGPQRPAKDRAEEWLDRTGQRVGFFASMAGTRLSRFAALAREEVEDIWAEAHNLSRERQETGAGEETKAVDATEEARREAQRLNVDLREVKGSGINSRVTAEDVQREKGADPETGSAES